MRLVVLSPFKWRPLFGFRHLRHQRDQNSNTWRNSIPMCSGAFSCVLHVGARRVGGSCHRSEYMDCTLSHMGMRISGANSWRLCIMEPSGRICWHSARRKMLQLGSVSPPWQQERRFISQHANQHLSSDIGIIDVLFWTAAISGNNADSDLSSKS